MKIYLLTFIVFILILGNFYFVLVRFAERFDRIMGLFMGIILVIYFENYRNREFLVFSSWVLLVSFLFQLIIYRKLDKKKSSTSTNSFINEILEEKKIEFEDYSNKININPDDVNLYLERSRIAEYLKKFDMAIQDLTNAIRLNPEKSYFYYFLRHFHYKKIDNNKQALNDIIKAVELAPKNCFYERYLAEMYYILGQNEKALEVLSQNIEKNIFNSEAYLNRFEHYQKINQYKMALLDINKAIEIEPTRLYYYHKRVDVLIKMKEFSKALKDSNYCITKEPNDWGHYRVLSEVYEAIGNKEMARKYYEISCDLNPCINR